MDGGQLSPGQIRKVLETGDFRPFRFGSKKPIRFKFTCASAGGLRKIGFAVSATIEDELHLIMFAVAALYFFDKSAPEAKRIIRSICIEGNEKD